VFKSKETLQVVIDDYLSNKDTAKSVYGTMNCWDVSAITDTSDVFSMKPLMNEDIGCWDVSNVTNMDSMFFGAITFNQDIGEWNVSKVKTMNGMFYGATEFDQDITKWTLSGVQELSYIFYGAVKFNQHLCSWFNHIQDDSPHAVSVLTSSGCVFQMDPSFLTKEHFCQKCEPPEERRGEYLSFPILSAVMFVSLGIYGINSCTLLFPFVSFFHMIFMHKIMSAKHRHCVTKLAQCSSPKRHSRLSLMITCLIKIQQSQSMEQ
jgi:hypothetical protein